MELTQAYLKSILHYDPETGIFINRKVRQGSTRAFSVAGCIGSHGYLSIRISRMLYLSHRLAFLYMTGKFPAKYVDHIDGDKLNNRWANLRDVSMQQNLRNAVRPTTNTSGVVGVRWNTQCNKWTARIHVSGRSVYLGIFDEFEKAVCARKSAEVKFNFHPNHGRMA
jgi:hypothetical protein